jgi:hypothetical protein
VNIPLAPPVPEAEIRHVWNHLGQPLSQDVLTLYRTLGGFAEVVYDDEFFWRLWHWNELERQEIEHPGAGVRFCDHSINLVTWEFRFEGDDRSSVWRRDAHAEGTSHQTAPSLDAFFRTYLANPWDLL